MAKRHAEKRRTSTCLFADRVARISVDKYHDLKASLKSDQEDRFACVATIVAHFADDERLAILSMGVGTKFLTETTLETEMENSYGRRVRDCHAEVLARRAFRRQMTLEMLRIIQGENGDGARKSSNDARILDRIKSKDGNKRFRLKEGVTLHMYTSSAPCGNSVLKKFGTMKRERFCEEFGPDQWPITGHEHVQGHSIRLGQFALLIKKDNSKSDPILKAPETAESSISETKTVQEVTSREPEPKKKKKPWPATDNDDWCPPGTTIVNYGKGSTHSCSDKILRWNAMGLQGSLLTAMLEYDTQSPPGLFMSTLTVGRKLTESMCRRAVCCRAGIDVRYQSDGGPPGKQGFQGGKSKLKHSEFTINHPTIMGTSVYLDESGTIDMEDADKREKGQDVRFHSSRAWAWWPNIGVDGLGLIDAVSDSVEVIDGSTGFLEQASPNEETLIEIESRLSTGSLTRLFTKLWDASSESIEGQIKLPEHFSLETLIQTKRDMSVDYEDYKTKLMREHRIFRQWMRRSHRLLKDHRKDGEDLRATSK